MSEVDIDDVDYEDDEDAAGNDGSSSTQTYDKNKKSYANNADFSGKY